MLGTFAHLRVCWENWAERRQHLEGISAPQTRGSRICGTLLSCFFVIVWLSSLQVHYEGIMAEYSKEKNYKIWRTSPVRQLRKGSRVRGRWDPPQVGKRQGSVHTKTGRGLLSRNITHSRLQTWDHLQSLAYKPSHHLAHQFSMPSTFTKIIFPGLVFWL